MAEDSLTCPITGDRLVDPVMDPEGYTYERYAILDWLSRNKLSPMTRSPLTPEMLVPNRALANILAATNEMEGLNVRGNGAKANLTSGPAFPMPGLAVKSAGGGTASKDSGIEAPPFEVKLRMHHDSSGTVCINTFVDSDSKDLQHSPCTVVCVIDISYSMDSRATMHGDEEGSSGLSLLDVVKHATRTVIETLQPHDRLGIVAYANDAMTVFPIKPMNAENKVNAYERMMALKTLGQTNLWDGLRASMDLIKAANCAKANIMLLTDGMPNIEPPKGHLPTLREYKDNNPGLQFEISTFGFGYSLNSGLLHNLAVEGGGTYSFIPDSSFVGTCFVNALANILATAVPMSILALEPINGAKLTGPLSEVRSSAASWGLQINMAALHYGQATDVLVRVQLSSDPQQAKLPPLRATLKYGDPEDPTIISGTSVLAAEGSPEVMAMQLQHARLLLIQVIRDAEHQMITNSDKDAQLAKNKQSVQQLAKDLQVCVNMTENNEGFVGLVSDLSGQVTEAYTRLDWHKRWGRHYLASLARAHTMQLCTNFKDSGLQRYAGAKVATIRDHAEGIFVNLPPPKPSLSALPNGAAPAPVTSMSQFHNADNPCFAAGMVRMSDGGLKSVTDVAAGDTVATGSGGTAAVKCVVVTACYGGEADLIALPGGVVVTKYHPVRLAGADRQETAWQFPCEMQEPERLKCKAVYSFVLSPPTAGSMVIGGFEAVTLGHGMKDDCVAHEYLGTEKCLTDLQGMEGWEFGRVYLHPGPAARCPVTGLIVGLLQEGHVPQPMSSSPAKPSHCAGAPPATLVESV